MSFDGITAGRVSRLDITSKSAEVHKVFDSPHSQRKHRQPSAGSDGGGSFSQANSLNSGSLCRPVLLGLQSRWIGLKTDQYTIQGMYTSTYYYTLLGNGLEGTTRDKIFLLFYLLQYFSALAILSDSFHVIIFNGTLEIFPFHQMPLMNDYSYCHMLGSFRQWVTVSVIKILSPTSISVNCYDKANKFCKAAA